MSETWGPTDVVNYYTRGHSLAQTAARAGLSVSTVRYHVKRAGALRSRAEGLRLAASQGRLSHSQHAGLKRTPEQRERIRQAAMARGGQGWRINSGGYVELTRGRHKGRALHAVIAEAILGRPLFSNEVVHHKDHDRTNNAPDNLEVMTRSAHTALHRKEMT